MRVPGFPSPSTRQLRRSGPLRLPLTPSPAAAAGQGGDRSRATEQFCRAGLHRNPRNGMGGGSGGPATPTPYIHPGLPVFLGVDFLGKVFSWRGAVVEGSTHPPSQAFLYSPAAGRSCRGAPPLGWSPHSAPRRCGSTATAACSARARLGWACSVTAVRVWRLTLGAVWCVLFFFLCYFFLFETIWGCCAHLGSGCDKS